MDPKKSELRDRLLAQQAPDPERLAAYRKGVEAMVEHLRRQAWWVGCAYAVLVILGTGVAASRRRTKRAVSHRRATRAVSPGWPPGRSPTPCCAVRSPGAGHWHPARPAVMLRGRAGIPSHGAADERTYPDPVRHRTG